MKRTIVAGAVALLFGLVPPSAHATPPLMYAECQLDNVTDVGTKCISQWDLSASETSMFVSKVFTHANYHDIPARNQAAGTVRLEWLDPAGAVVFSEECLAISAHGDGHPAEFASLAPICNVTTPANAPKPSAGTQTIVVTAVSWEHAPVAPGTRIHGRIALSPSGDPI